MWRQWESLCPVALCPFLIFLRARVIMMSQINNVLNKQGYLIITEYSGPVWRLKDGSTTNEGRLEYKPNPRATIWHPICDETFESRSNLYDTTGTRCRLFCRILGYASMLSCSTSGTLGFGIGTGDMYSIFNETTIGPMPRCDPRKPVSLRCLEGEYIL